MTQTLSGSQTKINRFLCKISTIWSYIISKDGDLQSSFDNVDGNNIHLLSSKNLLNNNYEQANKGELLSDLPREHRP